MKGHHLAVVLALIFFAPGCTAFPVDAVRGTWTERTHMNLSVDYAPAGDEPSGCIVSYSSSTPSWTKTGSRPNKVIAELSLALLEEGNPVRDRLIASAPVQSSTEEVIACFRALDRTDEVKAPENLIVVRDSSGEGAVLCLEGSTWTRHPATRLEFTPPSTAAALGECLLEVPLFLVTIPLDVALSPMWLDMWLTG